MIGYVFEAYDNNCHRKVAIKRVEKVTKSMSREYEILQEIQDCPYVIKLLDFYYTETDNNKII